MRGASATRIFEAQINAQCEAIKSNPTEEGIKHLKEILETWDEGWYNKHRPELWTQGVKAIYQARVVLATYDRGA